MNMKRISIIVTALGLLVALTQCKKEQNAQTNENETVAITLNIKGNGGTRMDVNTVTGEVAYEEGDVIYVASGGKFIGTLTHNGTNFSGTITNPTVGEPLHFYFLGNMTPAETLTPGITESCSVSISDQTEHLPVIEYAFSNENYVSSATTFTAMLLNKCALVKFNVATISEAATSITGFNNKVTVDFTDASFIYSKVNGGNITLPAGNGVKWAILLPQEAMEAGEAGSAYSMDGTYTGMRGAVPAIADNEFLTNEIAVMINTPATPTIPTGAINGLFAINANGDQVYFSQGNLQYQASTNIWRFAENQWNYVGGTEDYNPEEYGNVYEGGVKCSNNEISSTYSGWIDLLNWGTSGYNHGAVCYQPWTTSTNKEDHYAYGLWNSNLYDQTGQADWGYNAISNGGNEENLWRTMTRDEWDYLLNTRNTASGIRYAKGIVNGVKGVVLLPDVWLSSIYILEDINDNEADYNSNIITLEDWSDFLEANGAVFLPASGARLGTECYFSGESRSYWTSSYLDRNSVTGVNVSGNWGLYVGTFVRASGSSVRLVCDAE